MVRVSGRVVMYRRLKRMFRLSERKRVDKVDVWSVDSGTNSSFSDDTSTDADSGPDPADVAAADIYSTRRANDQLRRCSATQFETRAEVHVAAENTKNANASRGNPLAEAFLDVPGVVSSKCTLDSAIAEDERLPPDEVDVSSTAEDYPPEMEPPTNESPPGRPSNGKHLLERLAEFYHHFPELHTEVRIVMANNTVVYLLGTNHADPQCPKDVAGIINRVEPQTVVIELCAWRACGCSVHRGNVFQTKPEFTFRYLRRVISQIGFLPAMIFFTDAFNEHNAISSDLLDYGGEFAVAAHLCEELSSCKILLADREIPITVKRQASGMGNWRGIRVSVLVTLALIFKGHMKTLLLRAHHLVVRDPRFYQVVVLERDIFLTYMIQLAAGMNHTGDRPQVVAVVGQGHLHGIQNFWGKILPQILPLILKPDIDF